MQFSSTMVLTILFLYSLLKFTIIIIKIFYQYSNLVKITLQKNYKSRLSIGFLIFSMSMVDTRVYISVVFGEECPSNV